MTAQSRILRVALYVVMWFALMPWISQGLGRFLSEAIIGYLMYWRRVAEFIGT